MEEMSSTIGAPRSVQLEKDANGKPIGAVSIVGGKTKKDGIAESISKAVVDGHSMLAEALGSMTKAISSPREVKVIKEGGETVGAKSKPVKG
jgi:hypothetical protein